jgi:Predicted dehydrogenases and related proteins
VRIALLGAGRIGRGHAAALAAMDEVNLTICDTNAARAEELAQSLGVESAGMDSVLGPGRVDGIVIATPSSTHEGLVLRCADVDIPFFCEKPVAVDLEGTRRCVEGVRRMGVPSQIGFQRRFDPGYVEARRRVRAGELGRVHRVHMLTCDQNAPSEQFVASSGGIFRDCLIHDFDALRWVTGSEVEEVFAYGAVRGEDHFSAHGDVDEAVVVLRMEDSTLVTAQTSRNNGQGYDVRMELHGSKGNATVGLEPKVPLVSTEPGASFPEETPWDDFIARFKDCYERELRAFVDLVVGRAPSACTVEDALEALSIAVAVGRSRREHRAVELAEIREG